MEKELHDCARIYIEELEELFGPCDPTHFLNSIKTKGDFDFPHPCYHTVAVEGKTPIDIQLSKNVIGDFELAKWQLAHECVHLLDPWYSTWGPTNFLEEGIATWFQNYKVDEKLVGFVYGKAEWMVKGSIGSLAPAIKNIRHDYALRIGEIPPTVLADNCHGLPIYQAQMICERIPS